MATIYVGRGRTPVQIDLEDAPLVAEYRWAVNARKCVVAEPTNGTTVLLHRVVMRCPTGLTVDHINGDRLDNRKANLRVCTQQQNAMNRPKPTQRRRVSLPQSRFIGVQWAPKRCCSTSARPWLATVCVDKRQVLLGRFRSEEEAAVARDAAATEAYGAFAKLNFPVWETRTSVPTR